MVSLSNSHNDTNEVLYEHLFNWKAFFFKNAKYHETKFVPKLTSSRTDDNSDTFGINNIFTLCETFIKHSQIPLADGEFLSPWLWCIHWDPHFIVRTLNACKSTFKEQSSLNDQALPQRYEEDKCINNQNQRFQATC